MNNLRLYRFVSVAKFRTIFNAH
ncbi:hypothetical protein CY0110_18532 [Crocosphaera chwakensis CCY0110]|uniref:Uncharacterized protein n=1 Tax=Crocosphaera chwakensis CCY0110 TaxID=391612 RepID=A3IJ38_9CHRO|nr:hypothetical protein CY0110_18532 [Crocosphaera chwakensis CCY0110]